MLLLAQAVAGGSFVSYAILFVALAGVLALVFLGCRAMGVPIPGWVAQAIGIVFIVVVIIVLILVIARVAGLS